MIYDLLKHNAILLFFYVIVGVTASHLVIPPSHSLAIYPAAGLAMAAVLWFDFSLLPAVAVGEFIVYYTQHPSSSFFMPVGALIAGIGAAAQAFLGAYGFQKLAKTVNPLDNSLAALSFIAVAAFLATLINAFVISFLSVFQNAASLFDVWRTWLNVWMGNVVGVLAIGTTVMSWYSLPLKKTKITFPQMLEIVAIFVILLLVCQLVFIQQYPLTYVMIPFPIWATMRFGKRLGSITAMVISLLTIFAAMNGYTGLGAYTSVTQILQLQFFIAVVFVTTLILSAILNERDTAFSELEDRVVQRADQLNEKNIALHRTLDSLTEVQGKIVEGERLVSNVINSMPSAMVVLDERQQIKRWNSEAQKLAEVSFEQAKGETVTKLFPFILPEINTIALANELKCTQKVEKLIDKTDHVLRYFELLVYPLLHANIEGTTLLMNEITDRIKMNETLLQQDKLASVGALTTGIAQELNKPITSISKNINALDQDMGNIKTVLKEYFSLDDEAQVTSRLPAIKEQVEELGIEKTLGEMDSLIKGIQEGSQRTSVIVKDIKIFSRLDVGGMKNADLCQGIDSALTLLAHTYQERIEIVKEYHPIPEIRCFIGKMNQVFLNLLTNAIQSIKGKGIIRIRTEKVNDTIVIGIKDSGQGIKKEDLDKVFEPFHTTNETGTSSGLSLSISYAIVAEHKGSIKVASEWGIGSEFVITLPITPVMEAS